MPRRKNLVIQHRWAFIASFVTTLLFGVTAAAAGDVRLSWFPVPDSAGYRIHVRRAAQPDDQTTNLGDVPVDADGIVRGVVRGVSLDVPNYFAVTSYDAAGIESPFSNELLLKPSLRCAAAPIAGCRAPTGPGGAVLSVRDAIGVTRDRLGWKWRKGATISAEDLGDPSSDTSYVLCIYDDSRGVSSLASSIAVQAGGVCGKGDPCWRRLGRRGFAYLNRAAGGVLALKLKQGAAGRATIQMNAMGEGLGLPAPVGGSLFQQDPMVTVQLLNDALPSVCWETAFGATAQMNTWKRFKDRSD